jgi:hypothetical protein
MSSYRQRRQTKTRRRRRTRSKGTALPPITDTPFLSGGSMMKVAVEEVTLYDMMM